MELHRDWASVERAAAATQHGPPSPLLFQRLEWFRLVHDHAPPVGELLACHASSSEGDTWLFLAVEDGIARAFGNWYSLRFSATAADAPSLEAIARALRTRRPAIDRIELQPLAPADPLPREFASTGWLTAVDDATSNWQIDTKGMSFEDYWATRGSRLRNTARRKAKAVSLEMAIHCSFDDQAWAAYESVYARSWKPAEGSPKFLRALAEQEGAAGRLRLGTAHRNGDPIAAQLWLVEDGTATIHKLAYVEEARELSAGTLLSVEMFRHVLDVDRVDRIDFGTGDDGYKAEWMDRRQVLQRLRAFNPGTARGLAAALRAKASELVRRARSH